MQPILLFVLVLVLFPLTSHAATLTGADLPGGGQTLMITENTSFLIGKNDAAMWDGTISNSGGFTVDFLNKGVIQGTGIISNNNAKFNFFNEGLMTGTINLNNNAGQFNFSNIGFKSGAFTLNNTGWGTVNFLNNSSLNGTLIFNTDGGLTYLQNNGQFSGTLNVLDQYNKTYILNNGTISAATLNLTANGALGNIQITNNGLITNSVSNNMANEGGKIIFDNTFGSADFKTLSALSPFYGDNSSFLMLYNQKVTADKLRVYGQLQDTSFLAAELNKVFADPDSGSQVVFNYVKGSRYLYLPMVLK